MITKEQIIIYLQEFYQTNKRTPTRDEFRKKQHAFDAKTVFRKFGSWNNALIEAGLKQNMITGGSTEVSCEQCGIIFRKTYGQIKKSKHNFCSQSCAGFYNNQHKSSGYRVSKLEIYAQECLTQLFPGFDFLFNKIYKGYELDIFLPEFNIAFELNGKVHFEPIYGQEKFEKIQNNDKKKILMCQSIGIELHTVDVRAMNHFNVKQAKLFMNDIIDRINRKIFVTVLPINL